MTSRSKFFDESSESSSDEQSLPDEKPTRAPAFKARRVYEEEDETEQKRLVRTEKEKRYDELKSTIRNISNAKKINDFGRLVDSFESLTKAFVKARKVVESEGMPGFYIVAISQLQDFVEECWERDEGSWKRSLDKGSSRQLSILRQRIRKYNRDFEEHIKQYKDNPASFEEFERDTDDEQATAAETQQQRTTVPTKVADFLKTKTVQFESDVDVAAVSEEESGESEWTQESSDEESSGSSVDLEGVDSKDAYKYFLKPEYTDAKDAVAEKQATRAAKRSRRREIEGEERRAAEEEEGWEEVKEGVAPVIEKPKMFAKDEEVTHDAVLKKVEEILLSRGKRGFDPKERCDLLIELRDIAASRNLGVGMDVYLLFEMIGLSLDRNRRTLFGEMQCDWAGALDFSQQLIDLIVSHPQTLVSPNFMDEEINVKDGPSYRIRGCLVTLLGMLNSELTRILQNTDAHEAEYVERLTEEIRLWRMIENVEKYLESLESADIQDLCRVYYLDLEHRYFRIDKDKSQMQDSLNQIDKLAQFIYMNCKEQRTRLSAILLQAYHLAVHDYWFRAKDLILMPFVQENVWIADVAVQVQYNRAQVQLGLCAFRRGLIKEAHNALAEIHSNNRAKELLAQGLLQSRNIDKTPEQEKLERQLLLPYHLHINLEVLESVYLMSAMLTELSHMASPDFDSRKRSISKQFYYQLRQSEKQPCYGPPDNMREHIFAAVRAMKFGDWQQTCQMLINPKMQTKVWRYIKDYERVQELVRSRVKEECLRIYLFTFSAAYDNIKLQTLAAMFQLDDKQVKTIVSRMIYKREIMASLDQPTRCLVMHRTHPSTIQSQNLQLAEKVTQLLESNDKMSAISSVGRLIGDLSTATRKLQVR